MIRDSLVEATLTSLFAALYAVGVVAFAPISFLIFQVRVADSLLPLAILFGLPACIGFSIGALVANLFGGLGMVDVLGGSSANLIACVVAWKLGQTRFTGGWFLATIAQNLILTVIVGTYLAYLLEFPAIVGWTGIFLGSIVAVNLIGYSLLRIVSRPSILRLFTSNGIKVYNED